MVLGHLFSLAFTFTLVGASGALRRFVLFILHKKLDIDENPSTPNLNFSTVIAKIPLNQVRSCRSKYL